MYLVYTSLLDKSKINPVLVAPKKITSKVTSRILVTMV
jgi:hypothetical protein